MKILKFPHKMLYRQARPVEVFGLKLDMLITRMFVTMYQHRGIGLAANQVGICRQIIVLNLEHQPRALINPVIYSATTQVREYESCLSIPDIRVSVSRPDKIHVTYRNRYDEKKHFEATGLLSRCIQHEVDHLHGVLINDERTN